jgi:hypothetical protein
VDFQRKDVEITGKEGILYTVATMIGVDGLNWTFSSYFLKGTKRLKGCCGVRFYKSTSDFVFWSRALGLPSARKMSGCP